MTKNKTLKLYGSYLKKLNHYKIYIDSLKKEKKDNNITNIKKYFNNNIFISINEFHVGNYNLFNNLGEFRQYLKTTPSAMKPRQEAKQEGYKIFLRKLF
uniref:Uncharacterized protein n=1 Tax=viral metagenome TaxID=1070528 RepID=A0A6C0C711_9ZZZZ